MPKDFDELTKEEQEEFLRYIREEAHKEDERLANAVHEEWLAKEVRQESKHNLYINIIYKHQKITMYRIIKKMKQDKIGAANAFCFSLSLACIQGDYP
jgi:hypothetical protein